MWNNAGLSTSVLITTRSPANGMVHHTVAKIFVSTKLRDLGPKSSPARTYWRMVATCICYQPSSTHLLSVLTTFSLASIKTPFVGTGFLGLGYPLGAQLRDTDDNLEFPQIIPICSRDHKVKDILWLAMFTPLPQAGVLESVLLSLKEGESLSESTVRRLRRKEAEIRAAAAEGRVPLSEYRRRKQKKMAVRDAASQVIFESACESGYPGPSPATRADTSPKILSAAERMEIVSSIGERRKVSVEDVERLAASASQRRRTNSHHATQRALCG